MFCKTSRKPSDMVLPRVPGNVITHPWYKAHPQFIIYNFKTQKRQSANDRKFFNLKAEERQGSHKSLVACGLAGVFFRVTG